MHSISNFDWKYTFIQLAHSHSYTWPQYYCDNQSVSYINQDKLDWSETATVHDWQTHPWDSSAASNTGWKHIHPQSNMQVPRHLFPLEMSRFEMSSADKIYILTKLRHKTLYADPTALFNIHSLVQLTDGLTVYNRAELESEVWATEQSSL